MIKKVLVISAWTVFAVSIILLTGFASRSHNARLTGGLDIAILRKADQYFITEEDVRTLLITHGYRIDNQQVAAVDIPAIEKLVSAHPAVQSCEACISVEGKVAVSIVQRRPVARLINLSGESFYFDDQGRLMPWTNEYTAPVILVNGYFAESYAAMYRMDFGSIPEDSAAKTVSRLDDIWNIVKSIDADTFLRAQMVQLYLSPVDGFELIPRVGNHKIVLGDVSGLSGKLNKLNIFYTYGLNRTGYWNQYNAIDLRYKNQIVCTKKPKQNGI